MSNLISTTETVSIYHYHKKKSVLAPITKMSVLTAILKNIPFDSWQLSVAISSTRNKRFDSYYEERAFWQLPVELFVLGAVIKSSCNWYVCFDSDRRNNSKSCCTFLYTSYQLLLIYRHTVGTKAKKFNVFSCHKNCHLLHLLSAVTSISSL